LPASKLKDGAIAGTVRRVRARHHIPEGLHSPMPPVTPFA